MKGFESSLRRLDAAWQRLQAARTRRRDHNRPLAVLPCTGYGSGDRVRAMGRVLRAAPRKWEKHWGGLRNGAALLARILAPAAPGIEVRVEAGGASATGLTNEEGRFDIEVPGGGVAGDGFLTLRVSAGGASPATEGRAVAPSPRSRLGILSDVDDTILESGVGDVGRWWLRSLTGGPFRRRAIPGMPNLYEALRSGSSGREENPFFYVSGSSWDLYDLLTAFLHHNGFPPGHIRLKDVRRGFGPERRGRQKAYKEPHIRAILDFYPDLPFLLVGDAGEVDADLYSDLVRDYPGRVAAVYIRLLQGPDTGRRRIRAFQDACAECGVEMLAVEHTGVAARHALERGWVREAAVETLLG